MSRRMWALDGPVLPNKMRMDSLTLCRNEADPNWDVEWTAMETVHKLKLENWKPSLGKTSDEFRAAAESAPTKGDKKNLMDMARHAAAEEREHWKKETLLKRAERSIDRSRFRCIGTPLLLQDERNTMRLRTR
jgi:hypothetical protein